MANRISTVPLSHILKQDENYIFELEPRIYPKLSVKLYGRGVFLDEPVNGANVKMKRHQLAKPGQVILSEIWAKKGAIGIVPPEGEGALITSHFFLFDIDDTKLFPPFMYWLLKGNYFGDALNDLAKGTTGYAAIRPKQFLPLEIPLSPLDEQRRIVARIDELVGKVDQAQTLQQEKIVLFEVLHRSTLFGQPYTPNPVPLWKLLRQKPYDILVTEEETYHFAGVFSFGRGVFPGPVKNGSDFAYRQLARLSVGNFVYPKLMAWEGAFGIVPPKCDGMVVSPEFPVFEVNTDLVLPETLDAYFHDPSVWKMISEMSTGTNVRRRRLHPSVFLNFEFPLPPMDIQMKHQEVSKILVSIRDEQKESLMELATLEASILQMAFWGGL